MKLYVLIFFLIFSACELKTTHQSQVFEHSSLKVLNVLSGGNLTCENKDNGEITPFESTFYRSYLENKDKIKRFETHIDMTEIVSCYTLDGTLYVADEEREIHEYTESDFVNFLHELASFYDRVYYIGHSYGGWLSMYVAASGLQRLNAIFTVDAISKKECTYLYPAGCLTYPYDISEDHRKFISRKVNSWQNYYQKVTWYLHSDAIPEAHLNQEVSLSHTDIVKNNDLWDAYRLSVIGGGKTSYP